MYTAEKKMTEREGGGEVSNVFTFVVNKIEE
jgi:hypothetical protein